MKKKKYMICLLSGLLISSLLQADLRDYVVIVNTEIHARTKDTFYNIADFFSDAYNPELADIFKNFALGGHGSGFILVDEDGRNYIITNRHVVNQAEKITVSFDRPDGEKEVYTGCEVLYVDNDLDLAFLQFHDGKKVMDSGFTMYTGELTDGDEIWSAGFPNLLGQPIWQFARGTITNARTYLAKLQDPDISHLLQHSASIDPGNSGGPLLIKTGDESQPAYQVVGINTWQISNRRNTFFSIPVTVMPEALEKAHTAAAMKNDTTALKENLEKQCRILCAEAGSVNPDFRQLHEYISYDFVSRKGWDSFLKILRQTEDDKEENDFWTSNFFNYSPIETMRLALAYLFLQNLQPGAQAAEIEFTGINFSDDKNFGEREEIRTNFMVNDEKKEIIWQYKFGHWSITYMEIETGSGTYHKPQISSNPIRSSRRAKPIKRSFYTGVQLGAGGKFISGSYLDQPQIINKSSMFSPGFNASLYLGKIFADTFSINTGVLYVQNGAVFKDSDWMDLTQNWTNHYLQFPLLLRLHVTHHAPLFMLDFHCGAGAAFALNIANTGTVNDYSLNLTSDFFQNIKKMNVALLLNTGFEWGAADNPLKYTLDLSFHYHLNPDWYHVNEQAYKNIHFSKFNIGMGIRYYFPQ